MKRLISWFNILLKKRRELRRWQRIVTVLAAVMTFVTTYALILPAITVERDTTGEVGGMYLEQEAGKDTMWEENALEPTDVSLDEDQENDAADPDAAGDETTAAPAVRTLEYPGSDYTVILTYDETSGIPEGAALEVSEITADTDEYQMYLDEAKKAMGLTEEESLPRYAARFFDIKIMADDQEFTPDSGVSVEITYAEPLAEIPDTEVNAVHFADETAEAEVIEANTSEVQEDGTSTVEFMAESFSVYGVIYTVDFHWEVDGNIYEYSLAGGDSMSFRELVEMLHIVNGDGSEGSEDESEEIDEFISHIADIRFSNENLVKVARVTEEEITAGDLKDNLGLTCDYSEELTEEEREAMDGKVFYPTDWALISLKAFDTEEYLTVEMNNGESFQIKVTDAQLKKTVIDAKGDTWEITVTYDKRAEIPDGSELEVQELKEGSGRYQNYLGKAADELGVKNTDDISYARFFDIRILDLNGEKVEPRTAVEVSIKHKDAVDVSMGDLFSIVHFAEDGTEVIREVELSEDLKETTYKQASFSVVGEVVQGNPAQGTDSSPKQYAMVVKYDGAFYSIDSDGTLTPVGVNDENNPTSVTLGSPMLWSYDQNGTIYHRTDATDTDAGSIAADFYYKFLDVNQAKCTYEEEMINVDNDPASGHNQGYIKRGNDVDLVVRNTTHVAMGDKLAWKVDSHKRINDCKVSYDAANHRLTNENGTYVLDVGIDEDNVLRVLRKPANESTGVPVYFTDVSSSVPGVDPFKHTVSHIDISIVGSADIQVPLAYGTYYDENGNPVLKIEDGIYYEWSGGQWVIVEGMDDDHPITIHKDFTGDDRITGNDIKGATITATDINGKPFPEDYGAFYVNGYSMNDPEAGEAQQVRIEGSFKVCTAPEVDSNTHQSPNDAATCAARLATAIKYRVTLVKHNQDLEVKWNGIQLFNGHNEEMKLTTDITLTSIPFTYWDDGNKCPPLWVLQWDGQDWVATDQKSSWQTVNGTVHWEDGAIYTGASSGWGAPASGLGEKDPGYWLSGIDFRLSGDQVSARAEIPGIEVTKYILDDTGRQIELDSNTYDEHPLKSVIHVYEKISPNYDSDDVLRLRGGDATRATGVLPADGEYPDPTLEAEYADLYKDYVHTDDYDFQVEIGNNGKGLEHNYHVTDGMYYIEEDKDSVAEKIIGADGTTYRYTQTHIESEYAWRDDEYTAKIWGGGYNEPVHVSQNYTDLSEDGPAYRSIPEVLGNYKDQYGSWVQENGASIRNTMLPFYVYNVYTPDVELDVEKQWVGYEPTADTRVTAELYYAKRIVKNADGTAVNPLSEWPEKSDYKKVDGATWDGTDNTGGEKNIFEDVAATTITLKADTDPDKNWKGSFKNLPHRLTDEEGNVWEFDYFVRETAVTEDGESIIDEFEVLEKKTEPDQEDAQFSDGKVTIINGKGSLQLEKKWLLPDGVTEYNPGDTEAEITAQLRRKRTVEGYQYTTTEKLVTVTIQAKDTYTPNPYNNGNTVKLWEGKVVEGSELYFSVACNGTSNPYNANGNYTTNNSTSTVDPEPVSGLTPNITYKKPMSEDESGINKNANVFVLRNASEGTVITASFGAKNSDNSHAVKTDNSDTAGFGYYIIEADTIPETNTVTVEPVNEDEPVTIEGKITDGLIKLNKTNGWNFTLSATEMEPGWEYYIVESSIQESNVPADQFTYEPPVRTVDEDGNVVYTAKNINKGLHLDVNKTWGSSLGNQAPANATVTVKLLYRTRLATDTAGEWSEWALVEGNTGAGKLFAANVDTEIILQADDDANISWKGKFERLPSTVKIDNLVYDVEYSATETAVTVDGRDETYRYKATVDKADAAAGSVSAGTITINNEKETVQVTVRKEWEPVPTDPGASATVELHRYARKTKGTISVILTDQNGAGVPGAVFQLYKEDGTAVDGPETTDVNGVVRKTGLGPGTYYWEQTTVPDGYSLLDGVASPQRTGTYTVKDNWTQRQEQTFELENKRLKTAGQATLTVTDNNEDPIVGATFTLYKGTDPMEDKIGLRTNDQGKIIVDDLEPGTYHFVQTETPEDYHMPAETSTADFTVQENMPGVNQTFDISMTNRLKGKGWVEITLTKAADGSEIPGAIFELWQGSTKLADGITDSNGQLTFGSPVKLDAGTYTVRQITTESNCMTAEAQNFTIGDDEGDVDQKNELFFENLYQSLGTATVTLRRADNNAAISGAEFELYKGDALIESGITDANGKVTFGSTDKLSAGTYTVRQISTSDGLETAADQTFTIRDDNDPDQRESLNFVNEEVSGNVTIRLYRKGGLGKWNWFLGEEYTGLKPNRTYRFIANVQSGMYPDRIRYCVIEGDIQDATSTSNEQELNSQGFNGNTYTFTFTPPENDKVYNLVLIANNWGVEGITDYRMVSTLGSPARPTVNSSPRRMAKAANRGGLKASAITDAQPHKVPEELADEYIEDAAFTVKTYTITSEDENWSYTFPAEDKYDADGNEYYYYIVETGHTPSNYWIEEYEGDPLSETGTIKVTNKQTPGALTITKDVTVDNGAVPADMKTAADGTYTFVITGPNSYSRTETITVTNGVATGSIVLEDLIPGDYTITETGSTNTNGISLDDPKTITVASGSQASANVAAFTNNLVTTDLMVLKVDVNGMTKPLPGAKFEIRRIDGDSETITYIGSASDPITTGDDGIATFTKLVTGYYEVWEKDPPPGYILTDSGKFYVKVEAGTVTAILQTESTAPKDWPSRPDEDHFKFNAAAKTAKVGNEPGAALPHTGGSGTMLYYLMGLTLIALAGIGIVMKRRLVR